MKHYFILAVLSFIFCSCNQNAKHPQADLIKQSSATAMDEKAIVTYADSINRVTNTFDKRTSLMFEGKDGNFYIEEFSRFGKPILYIEYLVRSTGTMQSKRHYYLKNDSLLLIAELKSLNSPGSFKLINSRHYFRNNTLFKTETREATDKNALNKVSFEPVKLEKGGESQSEKVRMLSHAMNRNEQFDLVFERLEDLGMHKRISLKSNINSTYTASVLVMQSDELTDSLESMPGLFKDKPLKIRWKIVNGEAIYLPQTASMTSASGLKR